MRRSVRREAEAQRFHVEVQAEAAYSAPSNIQAEPGATARVMLVEVEAQLRDRAAMVKTGAVPPREATWVEVRVEAPVAEAQQLDRRGVAGTEAPVVRVKMELPAARMGAMARRVQVAEACITAPAVMAVMA